MKSHHIYLLVVLICTSCSTGKLLNNKKEEVKYILGCENFQEIKDGNNYYIRVTDTNLKSIGSKEMGASMVSLLLYEEFYKKVNSANSNSFFGVRYIQEDSLDYFYSLSDLSAIKPSMQTCESAINNFIKNKSDKTQFYDAENNNGIWDKTEIDWNKIDGYGLVGFQITSMTFYEKKLKAILFHYVVEPINKEIWMCTDFDTGKILTIINPQ